MEMLPFKEQINEWITRDSIFSIGKVHTIEGRKVTIKIYKDKNLSHFTYNGEIVKNVSVGSHIKVVKGFVEMIGKVAGERVLEDKQHSGKSQEAPRYAQATAKIERFLDISLIGYFEGNKFNQGIKEMPLIDNECYLFNRADYKKLYDAFAQEGLYVGHLAEDPAQIINLDINQLIASHIGIFGNTGSGKSNTLTRIYTQLFKKHAPHGSHFILFDFSGEYLADNIFMDNIEKKIYDSKNRYPICITKAEQLELFSILLDATEKTQKPFLYRAINASGSKGQYDDLKKVIEAILERREPDLGVYVFYELFEHLKIIVENEKIIEQLSMLMETAKLQFVTHYGTRCYITNNYPVPADNTPPTSSQIYGEIFEKTIKELSIRNSALCNLYFKILIQFYKEVCHSSYQHRHNIEPMIKRMPRNFKLMAELIDFQQIDDSSQPDTFPDNILDIIDLHKANFDAKKNCYSHYISEAILYSKARKKA